MGFAFGYPYGKWINSFMFAEKNKIQLDKGTLATKMVNETVL